MAMWIYVQFHFTTTCQIFQWRTVIFKLLLLKSNSMVVGYFSSLGPLTPSLAFLIRYHFRFGFSDCKLFLEELHFIPFFKKGAAINEAFNGSNRHFNRHRAQLLLFLSEDSLFFLDSAFSRACHRLFPIRLRIGIKLH